MKTTTKLLSTFIWVLFFQIQVFSQGGVIEGIIVDAQTRETMVGATILIEGTSTGTTANLNGEFRLTNIPAGTVNLRASFISYEPVVIENIRIERGQTITLSIELEQVSQTLEGVTVTARRTTYTETSLIQSIRNSQVVTSGISAQQITRSQDSDAAQVVRRIPGITIVEDRFIIVRGLSERYNVTMLHNTLAPSMEADVRSFSFDMIPASQIDHLLVFKSPSPDLPGDFAGGVVKVITKSIPDRSGFEVSYTSQYDDGTSFKPFFRTERDALAWTGFGSGKFGLPDDFPDDLRTITNNEAALQEAGRSMNNNWIPKETNAYLNHSGSLSGNLLFNLRNVKIGTITTLTYNNSSSINTISRADFNAYNMAENVSLPLYNFDDSRYQNSIKLGVLNNWGVEVGRNHSFEIINLYNNISSYNYVNRLGDHIDFGYNMNNHAFQQVFRGLYSGQVSGKHKFFNENTTIDWTGGYTYSFRDLPDYRQYRTERGINFIEGLDDFQIYVPTGGAQPYFMGRFFSHMEESGNSVSADITQKLNLGAFVPGFEPVIKAGVLYNTMERDFRARNIGYTQSPEFDQGLRGVRIDSLFLPENINSRGGIKIDEQSNPNDSYDASNKLLAYYGMINLPLGDRFSIVGGVRIENNHRILNSAISSGPVNVDNDETHVLPSVNFTWNLTEKFLVRGGYGKTLNRPELREQAPFGFFDFDNNWVVSGNQFLKTSEIDNFDLRLEYYPSMSEVFSISGFYKKMDNAIERIVLIGAGSGGSKTFSFGNADNAYIWGSEAEIKKSLSGLTSSGFVNDLSVFFNGTFLYSEVEIGSGSRSEGRDTDPRPLQGQSPYIVNAGLFYNNIDANLEVNVLYNIIGKRLFTGGFTELNRPEVLSYPDVYEMPRNYIDVTVSKRLTQKLNLRLKVEDILNQYVVYLQDANQDGVYDRENDQLLRKYKPGVSVKVSLGYKF
ncbi:MAG: TonB-dependent receptor [Bacteroidetes bacterium]|nr:MAG: TonB-dependent receptor [Bacteroidota bacterium]